MALLRRAFVLPIILSILMVYVIPKFKEVFAGMLEGAQLPAFTRFVLAISDTIREHFVATLSILGGFVVLLMLFIRTKFGRRVFDKFKLKMPVVGPVINKVAISRFTRTLGTLVSSGVPILQPDHRQKPPATSSSPTPSPPSMKTSKRAKPSPLEAFYFPHGHQHGGRR